jgi:hypothetical protein
MFKGFPVFSSSNFKVSGLNIKNFDPARHQWLILGSHLAIQEAEIRRIMVQIQPNQIVHKTLSKMNNIKMGWWRGSSVIVPA